MKSASNSVRTELYSIRSRPCRSNRRSTQQRFGLRKSFPAAIVLWAFHKIPSKEGLTAQRLISFLKQHYKTGYISSRSPVKSVATILRCAVEFGLLYKRGNRYFLSPDNR